MTTKALVILEKIALTEEPYVFKYKRLKREAQRYPENIKLPNQAEYIKQRKAELNRFVKHPVQEVVSGAGKSALQGAAAGGAVGALFGALTKSPKTMLAVGTYGAGLGTVAGVGGHLLGGAIGASIAHPLTRKMLSDPKKLHARLSEEYKKVAK